MFVYSIRRTLR